MPADRSIRTPPRGPLSPTELAVTEGGGDPWWGFNGRAFVLSLGAGQSETATILSPDNEVPYLIYPLDGILPAGAFLIRGSIDCAFPSAPTSGHVLVSYSLPDAEAGADDAAVGGVHRGIGFPRSTDAVVHFTGAILSDVPWVPKLTVTNNTNQTIDQAEIRYDAFGSTAYAHSTTFFLGES